MSSTTTAKKKEIERKGTRCLDSIEPQCPLCRSEFSPSDVCKLCVDGDAQSSTTAASAVDTQVQHLLDDIAVTANRGATIEEMERVIQQCNAYHNAQPNSILVRDHPGSIRKTTDCSLQHTPLGVSYLLLSTLVEAQRKLLAQGDQLSELAGARDDIRDRLTFELEAVRLQYRNSEQARRNERESALRNEEAFRAHYDEMNVLWRSKVESTKQKYRSLREELNRLRPMNQTATHGKESAAILPLGMAAELDKVDQLAFRLYVLPFTFLR
ncbi:hypothetical protein HD554DRAFT_1312084 [Boletus coccyginus]|nr:hypothetical protein HD554DRAFT_1312084 [Boletus coccyginus]